MVPRAPHTLLILFDSLFDEGDGASHPLRDRQLWFFELHIPERGVELERGRVVPVDLQSERAHALQTDRQVTVRIRVRVRARVKVRVRVKARCPS